MNEPGAASVTGADSRSAKLLTVKLAAAAPVVWRSARLASKPFLMPTLAARFTARHRGAGVSPLLAAQALSWGGDVALMGSGRRAFLAGLGSFLAAHLAYISAYRSRSSTAVLASSGRRVFMVAAATAASGMALAAAREDKALATPVAVYGVTLSTMVAAAAAVDADQGRGLILTGATLFLLSDALIGVHMFVAGNDSRALEAGVMATYTAGQWCITRGMTQPPVA